MSFLSRVAKSNLYTMGVTSSRDSRQTIPDGYTINTSKTRELRARLILEEALETVKALGCIVLPMKGGEIEKIGDVEVLANHLPEMEGVIDGCCDTIYVAVGTLCAMGVPDLPHLDHVCERNEAKFPGGFAITDDNGKFQKPPGWTPPNHGLVQQATPPQNLAEISRHLVLQGRKPNA